MACAVRASPTYSRHGYSPSAAVTGRHGYFPRVLLELVRLVLLEVLLLETGQWVNVAKERRTAAVQIRPKLRRFHVGIQFAHVNSLALVQSTQSTQNTQLHAAGAGRLVRNKLDFVASTENVRAIAA